MKGGQNARLSSCMKNKENKFYIIYLIFTGLIIFGYAIAKSVYYVPLSETTTASVYENNFDKKITNNNLNNKQMEFTPKLTIPNIGVSANIQYVGLTDTGKMATPTNFFDVGLYKYGPAPGEKGSSVIDGHVNNGLGLKAVFGNLKKIEYGDDIYVEMENGDKVHFIVTEISIYDFDSQVPEVFNQTDDYYLKLITCTGSWIKEYKTHDKRLVITAVKV